MSDRSPTALAAEIDRLASQLAERMFPKVAQALHASMPRAVQEWRTRSLEAMPGMHHLTIVEFENSIAETLHAVAHAMECNDRDRLRELIEQSPSHGLARFVQQCGPETLLAEERILRSVVIIELRRELKRPLHADEAAALHELLDMMGELSILTLMNQRREERDRDLQLQITGLHRLADLGTLVAGVAHDAANLLLPLRMRIEHLKSAELSVSARDDLTSIELIVKQFQNSVVNLRWLSVDPALGGVSAYQPRPGIWLQLCDWADEVRDFYLRTLPEGVDLRFDFAADLPLVAISSAALSQAMFNVVRNAHQAIEAGGVPHAGTILVSASVREGRWVDLSVEDNGAGMLPEVLSRCGEAFFTTRKGGSGIGLALVRALIAGCGGSVSFHSPPQGQSRGTAIVLRLPIAVVT